MKKLSLLAAVFVMAVMVGVPATADTSSTPTSNSEQLMLQQQMGLEILDWRTAGLGPSPGLLCNFIHGYPCRYIYNITSMCCVPYRPDPSDFCPTICL